MNQVTFPSMTNDINSAKIKNDFYDFLQ